MKVKYRRPRGTMDYLPDYLDRWSYIEEIWRTLTRTYGFREIRTPVFELTDLFVRGAGETSDIVSKEMYTFTDRGGRSISLRPEGTAAVARAYLENHLYTGPQPTKLFYVMPMFRYERPQAGRYRQHTQYGVEVIGSADPWTDAEVIHLTTVFYERLGIQEIEVHLNSVGDKQCRSHYNEILLNYLRSISEHLCTDCRNRMERNPLRVLDCKQQGCQSYLVQAPKMVDHLCLPCEEHFSKVRRYLEQFGITYIINPRLVRGLDYYTRTAFEVISKRLGAQDAIAGGGRYDRLLEVLGGNPTPAIGFGAGMERLIYALERHGIEVPQRQHLAVFVISVGEAARQEAEQIVTRLRAAGIASDLDHIASTKLKNQLTKAIRLGARYAAIIGDDELAQDTVVLRDLADASQESLARGSLVEVLRQRLDNSNLC